MKTFSFRYKLIYCKLIQNNNKKKTFLAIYISKNVSELATFIYIFYFLINLSAPRKRLTNKEL